MNRRLAVLAAAVVAACGAAVPANAARTVCLQIQDVAGDGNALVVPASQDSLDLLSGDIATGRRNLVAALRLKSVTPDAALVGGLTYTLSFTSGGVGHTLTYRQFGTGEREADLAVGTGIDGAVFPVDFLVDEGTATVTWIVPRKLIPALKKNGAKFTGLSAGSHVADNLKLPTGTMKGSFGADTAQSGRSYTDGTPTCLKGT
ncbi:MAG TPA: hypothetical protein VGX28_07495 [Frankiaceae bacterium]|jgi:hypothetical protein|nr:hypothetical protein [Frankiaceae bacterium]